MTLDLQRIQHNDLLRAPERRVDVDTQSGGLVAMLVISRHTSSDIIEFMCTSGSYFPVPCSLESSVESSLIVGTG